MSLATRCTACGTVFRVVQDQLKVSEGWVRCGRCKEVFNALEGLFDLEREAPPEWRPSQQVPLEASSIPAPFPHSAPAPLSASSAPAWPPPSAPVPLPAWPPASTPAAFSSMPVSSTGAWSGSAPQPLPPAVAAAAPAMMRARAVGADPEAGARGVADARSTAETALDDGRARTAGGPAAAAHGGTAPVLDDQAPAFIREAHARERWQQPRVRLALGAAAACLGLLLAAQVSLHFRDGLAAGSPGWKPLLEALCGWTGCQLAPPRRIEDIAVESSALTRVGSGPAAEGEVLRLSVTLRNRAPHELALPMIDLSLTDPNGQLVVRRALAASDFHHRQTILPAQGEAALQLQFTTGGQRVAGYTVEVFYP